MENPDQNDFKVLLFEGDSYGEFIESTLLALATISKQGCKLNLFNLSRMAIHHVYYMYVIKGRFVFSVWINTADNNYMLKSLKFDENSNLFNLVGDVKLCGTTAEGVDVSGVVKTYLNYVSLANLYAYDRMPLIRVGIIFINTFYMIDFRDLSRDNENIKINSKEVIYGEDTKICVKICVTRSHEARWVDKDEILVMDMSEFSQIKNLLIKMVKLGGHIQYRDALPKLIDTEEDDVETLIMLITKLKIFDSIRKMSKIRPAIKTSELYD